MRVVDELLEIMRTLRDPERGCPWDREQTFASILPYTLEEIYELAETIDEGDMDGLRDELGDLLFHVVYYARMAEEEGHFDFEMATAAINEKLRRRHPHVFGDTQVETAEEQTLAWERIKAEERRNRDKDNNTRASLLDGISKTLPAMVRAHKLQRRAAGVGFDWDNTGPVIDKIEEELSELRHEINDGMDDERITDEMGDLLFACVNLARHLQIDPELALRNTNRKFEQRFRFIEDELAGEGQTPDDVTLEEMESLWQKAKAVKLKSGK